MFKPSVRSFKQRGKAISRTHSRFLHPCQDRRRHHVYFIYFGPALRRRRRGHACVTNKTSGGPSMKANTGQNDPSLPSVWRYDPPQEICDPRQQLLYNVVSPSSILKLRRHPRVVVMLLFPRQLRPVVRQPRLDRSPHRDTWFMTTIACENSASVWIKFLTSISSPTWDVQISFRTRELSCPCSVFKSCSRNCRTSLFSKRLL